MPSLPRTPPSPADLAAGLAAADTPAPAWWPAGWACRSDGAADGVSNMAIDLALLDQAATDGVATLRTYAWARDTVSFGRHEPVRAAWDVDAMRDAGLDVVRRPTGGRALLHGADLTYAVALPLPREVAWRAAYAAINTRLLRALRSLGVPATIVERASAFAPADGACFAAPAVGELAVGPHKLAGSAVWRGATAFLQHGSILVHDRQARLAAFRRDEPAGRPIAQLPPAATLEPTADEPTADEPTADGPAAAATTADATEADATAADAVARWRARGHVALRAAFALDARVRDVAPDENSDDSAFTRGTIRHRAGLAAPAWLWRR